MYCIISLPRTASTFTWHQIHASMVFVKPEYHGQSSLSAFNPRYLTPKEIEEKYQRIMSRTPLPLIKIISNHDFSMVERILETPYKTIFIKPKNLRKQVLKVLVAKKTDSFSDRNLRDDFVGKVVITEQDILERFSYYKKHMAFENQCDYSFYGEDVLADPQHVTNALNLPFVKSKYKYTPQKYSDVEMLENIEHFNKLYDELAMETFGELP